MTGPDLERQVAAVRGFNRFYTRQIGVIGERLLASEFSLAEVRVLYELAHRDRPTAAEIARDLGLDAGYLSRILRDFEKRGLIAREPSATDGRQSHLSLTERGRSTFGPLDARTNEEVGAMLAALPDAGRARVLDAMRTIHDTFAGAAATPAAGDVVLRAHRPGDMGWIVHRQAVLYHQEFGWDESYESLILEILAKFLRDLDPERERCWVAERNGEIVGSIFCVKHPDHPDTVAKLRMLYVEPSARGLGLGTRLVDECIAFARAKGYRRLTLWTNSVLHAARRIYQRAGFTLTSEEVHRNFGHELVAQVWDLEL